MLLTLYFQYLAHSRCSITSVEQEEGKERKWEEGCKRKKEGKEGEGERERKKGLFFVWENSQKEYVAINVYAIFRGIFGNYEIWDGMKRAPSRGRKLQEWTLFEVFPEI